MQRKQRLAQKNCFFSKTILSIQKSVFSPKIKIHNTLLLLTLQAKACYIYTSAGYLLGCEVW
jgi:hypothetical protein